jgi:hypothetical protein
MAKWLSVDRMQPWDSNPEIGRLFNKSVADLSTAYYTALDGLCRDAIEWIGDASRVSIVSGQRVCLVFGDGKIEVVTRRAKT